MYGGAGESWRVYFRTVRLVICWGVCYFGFVGYGLEFGPCELGGGRAVSTSVVRLCRDHLSVVGSPAGTVRGGMGGKVVVLWGSSRWWGS